ncbi:hypothetical protein DPMN_033270 [Dreissena polymorpha]|uniref:Uncharacterized protein n=1 Tax=Dreissena polymorpha TaxID=45954 RepID=A0A9D4RL02_DREPO|nr:hypothetical protein DPMN_033270 [Dreissena polymorpha]
MAPWQPYIIKTNFLTKFHEDWTINEKCSTHWQTCFQPSVTIFKLVQHIIGRTTGTIFELAQDIIGTNLLTKFHDVRTINVASRVLRTKNAPSPGGHVFQPIGTIFEINVNKANVAAAQRTKGNHQSSL